MKQTRMRRLYFVDLFAGCGGLSLGLEQAGWEPVFVNELNADAMRTYLSNQPRQTRLKLEGLGRTSNDIKQLVSNDGRQLKALRDSLKREEGIEPKHRPLDLVVGGPPCQGYSGIGHRRSYSVHKRQLPSNHLYQDMAFVVAELRPKIFLFENVRGLLTARWDAKGEKHEIWNDVRETFKGIGEYRVFWSLVYAKTYGVPQNRPRVLMVGLRSDVSFSGIGDAEDAVASGVLPVGDQRAPDLVDVLGDLVDPKYLPGIAATTKYPRDPAKAIQEYFRRQRDGSIAAKGEPLTEQDYSNHSKAIVAKFRHMIDNGGEIPSHMRTKKFAQRVLPKRWGPSGPSITATSLSDDYVHFSQPRNLTVREWARLQMFPDWYQFSGKRTTGGIRRAGNPQAGIFDRELPKYTQIGNAVPVGLANAVGKHFRSLLETP